MFSADRVTFMTFHSGVVLHFLSVAREDGEPGQLQRAGGEQRP